MKPKEKTWRQFIPTELVQLLLVILLSTQVNSQCFGGTETYEKTTGVKFLFGTSQGILTQPGTGITRDCTAICRQTQTCRAFTVDYENSRCQSYTMDSAGQRNNIQDKVGSNFFEKICLLGVSNLSKVCDDRMWAFERVVGAYLEGFDDREERNVQTKAECEKLCLFETTFTCRSAEFDETQHICRLSREDRRSQPNSFRRQLGSPIDYLENQCVRSLPDCRYTIKHDSAVISMDELQFAATYAECEALCKQTRAFTCRAFTYAADEKRCYLSGDDSVSLSNAPLVIKRGAVYAEKQCSVSQCEDGIFTFEKVTGHFLRSAQPVGLAMATSPGVTLECSKRCLDAGSDCPAFSLDYNGMKCFKLDRNTQGRSTELSPREGQSYFEKICLHGNIRACSGKAWAFERRPAKEIRGFDDKKVPLVQSRRDCAELCLNERRFECRSAEYDVQTAECRLSREDRRSQPNEYIDAPPSVEYLENQCLPPETYCNFEAMPNSYPRYLDVVMPIVSDESECERRCHTYSEFTCRSYSYYPSGSQCFMSGDDRASAGSDALMSRPGTNYFERNCRDLSSPGNNHLPHPGNPITDPQVERCPAGRLTFEKITGHELQGQQGYPLLRETVPGITEQCARRCQSDPRCRSFNLDYTRNDCVGLGVDSELARIDLRPTVGMAYFESICLRGGGCGLAWTFERHMNFELRGFEKMRYPGISKTECEDRCLEERQFSCRSATYNHRRRECRLSTEDRFTQPQAFVAALDSDYLENQCSVPLGRCVYRNQQRDRQLLYTDKSISAFSDSSCQHACDVERGFVCRSYTFLSQTGINTNQCLLSGDTGATAGTTGFLVLSGALYAEKECSGLPGPGPHQPPTDPYNPLYPGGQSPGPGPFPPGPAYPPYPTDSGVQPYPDATDLNPYPCRYTLTYEKIAGAAYPNSRRDPIRTRGDIGITAECLVECAQQRDRCLAISLENVRGGRQRCYALDRSSDSDNAPLQPAPDLGYFQKICLRERPCAKAWAFTRVPSYEFVAPNSVDIRNVFSRRQCQDECLRAARITCRSATYYKRDRICKLSPDTRRTHPEGFHRTSSDVDYMENECAPQPPNCEYTDQPGRFLPYSDRFVARAYDVNECRRLCDQEREFQCRSFNFHIVRRECFLSSDDAFTADRSALLSDRDFFYSERGSCSNVRVDCTQSDMLVTFLFGAPFEGRVYATGNPQACFEMGSGQSQLVLRIPMGTQCGTVQQGRGRYVNHVVIQQNPVIMQETDKTVRVECSFDASDQTVSYAPSGTREQEGGGISVTVPFRPSGTNIVTNTAPTPNVRMRILLRNGQEAAIVGLGEPLQLRIESDPSSAFGIYARNLEARTDNGELLTLIDNSGCPRDPDIFPSLELEPGSKDLIAEFKAFRFPSTATVNFVSTIHFCQDGCEPVRCYNGVPSYGRRRRSAGNMTLEETTDGSMSTEENHHTEITTSPTTSETVATFVQEEMTSTEPMPEDVSNSEGSALPQGNETTSASPTSSTSTELPLNPSNDFHPRGPEIRNELSTRAPPRPTTTSTKSPTSTKVPASGKEPPNVREPAPMPGIPNELPLQLQLVVGEDSIPKPTKNNDKNRGPMNGLGGKGTRPEFYPAGPYGENAYTEDGYVCSPKSTVIASVLTLLFFNAGLVGGFIFFYRVKKKQWEKLSSVENVGISPPPHNSARPAMFAPEVLFRNVYDRLPPNPTFSTLGHLSSTGQGNLTSSNPIYETAS